MLINIKIGIFNKAWLYLLYTSFLLNYRSAAYEMFEHNIDDIIRHSTHIILKGEFQGDWEQRINDYADGKFERPFELSDINDNLGID